MLLPACQMLWVQNLPPSPLQSLLTLLPTDSEFCTQNRTWPAATGAHSSGHRVRGQLVFLRPQVQGQGFEMFQNLPVQPETPQKAMLGFAVSLSEMGLEA